MKPMPVKVHKNKPQVSHTYARALRGMLELLKSLLITVLITASNRGEVGGFKPPVINIAHQTTLTPLISGEEAQYACSNVVLE